MGNVINPAYLSMPAQVQKNMEDIEALRNSAFVATPAGQYSAATTYGKGALVAYTDGNIYYHFSDTETQGVPPTDTANWVIYQEGIPGPQGKQGIQGSPGNDGKDGVTPNITATATVSNTTGTPSVNVSKGGTAENPSFAFAFQNIKGEPGEKGEPGASALIYQSIYQSVNRPNVGNLATLILGSFSRTPAINESVFLLSTYNTGGASPQDITYACIATVTNISGSSVTVQFTTAQRITRLNGEVPQLYRHIITFSTSSPSPGCTIIYSYRSSEYDLASLNAALTAFGCISPLTYYPANGYYNSNGEKVIYGIFAEGENVSVEYSGGTGGVDSIYDIVSQIL